MIEFKSDLDIDFRINYLLSKFNEVNRFFTTSNYLLQSGILYPNQVHFLVIQTLNVMIGEDLIEKVPQFGNDAYELTNKGFRIKESGGWQVYLSREKEKQDKEAAERQEMHNSIVKTNDLQRKTLLITILTSTVSCIVALLAYFKEDAQKVYIMPPKQEVQLPYQQPTLQDTRPMMLQADSSIYISDSCR